MTRYIDADMCIAKIKDLPVTYDSETVQRCIEVVSNAPTIDTDMSEYSDRLWKSAYERGKAESVKRGKWIETDEWDEFSGRLYKCSNCKTFVIGDIDNYCPYCGARMDEE